MESFGYESNYEYETINNLLINRSDGVKLTNPVE